MSIATSTNIDLRFIDENLALHNLEEFETGNNRTTSKTSDSSYSSMDTSDSLNAKNKNNNLDNKTHARNMSDASILAEIFPEDYKTRLMSVKSSRMDLSLDSDGMLKFPPLGQL